jgi:hypothetical protein
VLVQNVAARFSSIARRVVVDVERPRPCFPGFFLRRQGLFSNRPKTQRPPAPIADEKRNRMANEGEAATERWHQSIP